LLMLTVGLYASTAEFCRAHASVYGMVAILRGALCGEAVFGLPIPTTVRASPSLWPKPSRVTAV
jgi:hypothetical protein